MKKVTIPVVKRLVAAREVPSISIYMNVDPRHPGCLDDRLRLREQLRRLSELLEPMLDRRGTDALLTPLAERAREERPDARSVAFLRSPGTNEAFALPVAVPELAIVSSTFHTKPLIGLLEGGVTFAVLAFGDGVAHLYEGTRDALERVEDVIPGAAMTPAPRSSWYRAIDAVVCRHLEDTEAPVVLAGEHHDVEAFRSVSQYPRILDRAIDCRVRQRDLLEPAVALVDGDRANVETEAAVQYLAAAVAGHATDEIGAVARAAVAGRVPLVLHCRGAHVWGVLDRLSGDVTVRRGSSRPGDADLIDDVCEIVLWHGGDVVELAPERMPCLSPIGAVVRSAMVVPARPTRCSQPTVSL